VAVGIRFYRLRRVFFMLVVGASLWAILLIARGRLRVYNGRANDTSHLDIVLGTAVQTTATVCSIALALLFITAPLLPTNKRSAILRELYRSFEIYVLLAYFTVSLISGYWLLAALPTAHTQEDLAQGLIDNQLIDSVLVLAVTSVLLLIPTLLLQIENLDSLVLAVKLMDRVRPRHARDYGLVEVRSNPGAVVPLHYGLVMVGLRPKDVDPLRPIHELLMEAVESRDRVLFGKLIRVLLGPIAAVYGARWNIDEPSAPSRVDDFLLPFRRLRAWPYSPEERIQLTLTILHYNVKRARNLLVEWKRLDIGRHGILTGIGDLIVALAPIRQSEIAIRISLFAAMHIEAHFADVEAYGRIEPMNVYFLAMRELHGAMKTREAHLCAEILGWIGAHTDHIAPQRSPHFEASTCEELNEVYQRAYLRSSQEPSWIPGLVGEDPWRTVPWAQEALRKARTNARRSVSPA
jgi:hypothetical protein